MALLPLVTFALLLLEDDHLVPPAVFDHGRSDARTSEIGAADPQVGALTGGQDGSDVDRGTCGSVGEAVHDEDVACADGVLLPLGLNGRFHGKSRNGQ